MSDVSTPEEFFINPSSSEFPIDAINCAHARANSILTILLASLGNQGNQQFHPHTIADALWQVQGNLEQIKFMVNRSFVNIDPVN
jgi:hypothetical protein